MSVLVCGSKQCGDGDDVRRGATDPLCVAKAGDAVVAPKQTGAQGFYKVWVSDAPIKAEKGGARLISHFRQEIWYNYTKRLQVQPFSTQAQEGINDMEFDELISDFAERHNIANLAAENNAVALDVDGIVVTLVTAGDALSISAEIGEPPSEGKAEFAELMLEANLQSGAFFAKEPESGAYVLVRRLQLQTLDSESFDTALEEFVNLSETWRRLLADFRPVAKAAAERIEDAPQFGAKGFFQV